MDIQDREDINNEPFVLDDSALVIDGITLAADQGDLTRGAVLAEIVGDPGVYQLVDVLDQSSNIPSLFLATEDVEDSVSETTGLSAYKEGLFNEYYLVFGGATLLTSRLNAELMPNLVDRDFSGASAWANVDFNSYDATGDLSLVANAAAQYATLLVASAPTEIGQPYRWYYDLAKSTPNIYALMLFTYSAEEALELYNYYTSIG